MAKKVEVPEYVLENVIRHLERMIELGQPKISTIRAIEAFRLARQDVAKLKRLKNQVK